jgi:hypothetical protein
MTSPILTPESRLRRPESAPCPGEVAFTIGTLVTDRALYGEMRASLQAGGFGEADCEYLFIDNTLPAQVCAYRGLNAVLSAARGRYVILCHQDVRLLGDGRAALEARLSELDRIDPHWALAGNAGGVVPGELALRITDPHGRDQHVGQLPARVVSLDENFIVVKRACRVGFSNDLTGFHFYGADICLGADIMGYASYVIDFHLEHLSGGNKSAAFENAERQFREKWSRALRGRWVQTTCSLVRVAGDSLGQIAARLAETPYEKLSRRLPSARGWARPKRPAQA